MISSSRVLYSVTLACCLVGCGPKNLPDGPTGTVVGKVTSSGNPVPAKSSVLFIHTATSYPAAGEVGPDGSFTLQMKGDKIVMAGPYTVAVIPPPEPPLSPSETAPAQPVDKYPQIPKIYRSTETSPLKVDVKPGPNTIELKLDPQAK